MDIMGPNLLLSATVCAPKKKQCNVDWISFIGFVHKHIKQNRHKCINMYYRDQCGKDMEQMSPVLSFYQI